MLWPVILRETQIFPANKVLRPLIPPGDPIGGEVLEAMHELAESHGVTMIIVTHEMQFARDVADHVVFMDSGKVVEEGTPADVFGDPKTERLGAFLRGFVR